MDFDPEKITYFAKTDARGQNVRFGIKAKDRQRHVYVIGKTGMGKSTMLENMAVQDIQNGEGVAFIDPHGSTAEALLSYVPEDRVDDVLYFAPHDMEHPIAFNIMEDVGPEKRHLVVSGLMSVFKKIWVDAWSARMEYILQNTLMALLEYPDSTLLGVNKMLSDKVYRKKVVDYVTDPEVKNFWQVEFAGYTDRFAAEATPAIQNKIGQFTANPVIRNIIGQPKSSFDIRKMMDEKKIVIMNLSKGLIGESNANLLGSMLTTRIYLAAMSRADLPPQQMQQAPNFYFYVDEFQSFANATFANILSEARKYHLNLTIAHQYIEQMEEEVRNAVFGNVGTVVSFRVGPFDAEVLETIYAPQFTATDIVNLGFAQIYLTLMIDGIGSQPFSATTLPPIDSPSISYKEVTIAASRKQFASSREKVESELLKFHESLQDKTPPAEKMRNAQSRTNNRQETPRTAEGRSDRPFQNNRSPRQNNDRSRQKNGHSSGQKQPPKGKDLTELRSVLKGLSGAEETDADKGDQKPAPKKIEQKKEHDSSALKDALKNVIEKSTPASSSESLQTEEKETKEPQKQNETSQQDTKQDISPKELERMMRVQTNDKSPLR